MHKKNKHHSHILVKKYQIVFFDSIYVQGCHFCDGVLIDALKGYDLFIKSRRGNDI